MMTYYFKHIILGIFLICTYHSIYAQSKINFAEINISLMQPTGFFSNNVNKNKIGIEFGYLRQLKEEKPLFWGLSLYYHQIDRTSATISEVLDFQIVDFDYSTTSNLLGFHGKMRFYPNVYLGKLEWYIEAQLGYKWLFTNTTKMLTNDTESSDTSTEKGALSLTYGVSTGINYPINDEIFLNLRVNYLPGLSVPYYIINPEYEIINTTLDQFDLKRSTTDILRWDFGITYRF